MRAFNFLLAATLLAASPIALAQTEPSQSEVSRPADAATAGGPAETAAPDEQAMAVEAPEPELICRSVTVRTESRLRSARERVCRTQAQWDAIEQEAARSGGDRVSRGNN